MTGESKGAEGRRGHMQGLRGPTCKPWKVRRWEDASQDDPPLQVHEADEEDNRKMLLVERGNHKPM